MEKYNLIEETLGYVTAEDETNTSEKYLTTGSYNCLIDQQRKVKSRAGYTRKGDANAALTPVRTATTWNTSTGSERPLRQYDDELEVWIGTLDGVEINDWIRVEDNFSTTEKIRYTTWWDTGENMDLLCMVNGDTSQYEWSGAVAVVASITGTTITKEGTTTFAENRFYTTRNKIVKCVRTGTQYTYTGGEGSTTLTGIGSTAGLVPGDILINLLVEDTDTVSSSRINNVIFTHENQICLGSNTDEEVYVSQNDDKDDFTFSSPRLPGEGALLTLEDPASAFGSLGKTLVIFGGRDGVYTSEYEQITVGTDLAETLKVKKLQTGMNYSAINHEGVVAIGNGLAYISWEPALRIVNNPEDLVGIDPKTYSNPIKPDFDNEDFTDVAGLWSKNTLHYAVPASSRLYMLEFREDADGRTRRFWQAPQIYPVGALSLIEDALHGHSNAVPESYRLFYGTSDGMYDGMDVEEKIPIKMRMAFAYRVFGDRANLKNLDEYYSEGQITPNTLATARLLYDFGGDTQTIEKTIDGSDVGITFEDDSLLSLGQSSLGTQPLGGSSVEPDETLKYRVIFEFPKEDFHEIQEIYEMDQVDGYLAVISRGMNARLSTRRDTIIRR